MERLEQVDRRARGLMASLGGAILGASLQDRGWDFGFDRARRRLGACHPAKRRITLSRHLAQTLPLGEVEDTIRHEIAHAIDVERRGRTSHDAVWKRLAAACGASPERCAAVDLPADAAARYRATCPSCGAEHAFYRQPVLAKRCAPCARSGEPSFLRVVERETGRVIWAGGERAGPFGGDAGWHATCAGCGQAHRRTRRPSRPTACAACCKRHAGGRYDPRFRLRFSRPNAAR
jgi:predicted SprT family Zn-dependent metalloprotease